MTTYFEQFIMPARGKYHVEVWLAGDDGKHVVGTHIPSSDTIADVRHYDVLGDSPEWRDDLPPNSEISPAGTKWARSVSGAGIDPSEEPIYFESVVSGSAQDVADHLTDVPSDVPSGAVETHNEKFHRKHIRVPSNIFETTWYRKRHLGSSQILGWDFWTDSIGAQGLGVTPDTVLNRRTLGMAGLFEAAMQSAYGDGGSGYLSFEYATITGTWTAEPGWGGAMFKTSGAGSLTWTNIRGTSIRMFIGRNVATPVGVFRWRIDGGGWRTVNIPYGFIVDPGSDDVTGLSDTEHTVECEWVSGTILVSGIYAERAAGVNIRRFGSNGRAAAHYSYSSEMSGPITTATGTPTTITSPSPGWFTKRMEQKYLHANGVPLGAKITAVASATSLTIDKNVTASASVTADLFALSNNGVNVPGTTCNFNVFLNSPGVGNTVGVVLCIGANDPSAAGRDIQYTEDGLNRILDPYFSGTLEDDMPTVIAMKEHIGDWLDVLGSWQKVAGTIDKIADGVGAAVIDSWAIGRRSHEYGQLQGWFTDTIHPSNLGHQVMYADPLIAVAQMNGS